MPRLIFAKKAATQALLATVLISTTTVLADEVTVNYDIIPRPLADTAVLLRERALLDNLSVDIVESLKNTNFNFSTPFSFSVWINPNDVSYESIYRNDQDFLFFVQNCRTH